MGGFVFDNSRNPKSHSFDGRKQVTIPRNILEWLAENEPDVIPDISSRHIANKSKANGLAKLLVCVQAGYFGLQTVARLVQGLTVTLLELNVFAHVVCTLLTYAFWWNKPLDIEEPTAIYTDDPKIASICAALWCRSSVSFDTPLVVRREQPTTELMLGVSVRIEQLILSPRRAQELWTQCFDSTSAAPHQGIRYFSNRGYMPENGYLRVLVDRTDYGNLENRILIELGGALVKSELEKLDIDFHGGCLGPNDQIYAAFKEDHLRCYLCAHRHPTGLYFLGPDSPVWISLKPRIRNWPGINGLFEPFKHIGLFTAASVLYGGWHLTAWNGPFRTAVEGILWKVSAVGVSVSVILEQALYALLESHNCFKYRATNMDPKPLGGLRKLLEPSEPFKNSIIVLWAVLDFLVPIILWLNLCLLIFSRAYLVVESCISLAFVPDGAFTIPQWSFYIPHIG